MSSMTGGEVIDLSGMWSLKFDPQNLGKVEEWFKKKPKDISGDFLEAMVPRVWQEYNPRFSGGVGWYFKYLPVQKTFEDKILRLKFWAVDYLAEVWINGYYAGSHEGGYTPFVLDITDLVKPGQENYLAVRVLDPPRGKPQQSWPKGLPGWEQPFNDKIENYRHLEVAQGMQVWAEGLNFGGIWQPVELIATEKIYINDIFITPDIKDGSAQARIEIQNSDNKEIEVKLIATVTPWKDSDSPVGGTDQKVKLHPGINVVEVSILIDNARLWSLEDPYLYMFNVCLSALGKELDESSVRFGLREFTVKDGFFYLNGKRIFIKGAHHQSNFPITIAYPHTPELAYYDVKLAKEAGFNFSRIICSPASCERLDAADEIGLLIQEEPPLSFMRDTPRAREIAIREVKELVKRDRNRPSLVIWNMINESAPATRYVAEMCLTTRELDPTRLITETNGGRSRYYLPYSDKGISYVSEHLYNGAPITEEVYRYCSTRAEPGQLYFITEFGFAALPNLDEILDFYEKESESFNLELEDYRGWKLFNALIRKHFRESNLKDVFSDFLSYTHATQELQASAIRLQLDALRSNPSVAGYNYVCLWETNALELDGVVNFTRNGVKKAYHILKEINKPCLLIVHCDPMNIRSSQETQLKVTLVNEEKIEGSKRLVVEILSQNGESVYKETRTVEAKLWVSVIFDEKIKVEAPTGKYKVKAKLLEGEKILTQREDQLTVIHEEDLAYPNQPITLFDPEARLEGFLKKRNIASSKLDLRMREPSIIVVPGFNGLWKRPSQFMDFMELFDLVKRGCTALFLEIPESGGEIRADLPGIGGISFMSPLSLQCSAYPYNMNVYPGAEARLGPYHGLGWQPPGVLIPKHFIFEGLPNGCLMDREYGNVAPNNLLETSACPAEDLSSLVQIISYGSGRIIFSSFSLLPYLGTDAVAEKILCNLLKYAEKELPTELKESLPEDRASINFRKQQYRGTMKKFFPDISVTGDQ